MSETVYLTRKLPESVMEYLAARFALRVFKGTETPVPPAELMTGVKGCSAILSLLTDSIDAKVMDAAGCTLKVIGNMAVGFDNIDLAAARERGIVVTNTPDILTETTADLAFALMLAVARRIPESERVLRTGKWQTWSPMFMTGMDVYGKTLGIVGMGRIGEAVARRAKGFGMNILYHNRHARPEVDARLQTRCVDLPTLMAASDFVAVLVPLTPDTRGLVGEKELALMKPTAVLVNVARGWVVDESALVRVLSQHRIWGAGLDVYEQEPLPADSPLLQLDNVVLLPHIGSASVATRTEMALLAARNIEAVLTGQPALNPVK